ncbi:hypothetical protein IFM89_004979, partial [Coptis chinensis]
MEKETQNVKGQSSKRTVWTPPMDKIFMKLMVAALKKNHSAIRTLIDQSGFGWDNDREMVYADDDQVLCNTIEIYYLLNKCVDRGYTMSDDSDEEDMIMQAACVTTMLTAGYYQYYVNKIPCRTSALSGTEWVEEVLTGHGARCQENFCMEKHVFLRLCDILQTKGLLTHSDTVQVEEQLAIFMYTISHNERNRTIQERFQHSGETISRHFNNVLNATVALSEDFLQPAGSSTPKILDSGYRFYPYFK